MHEILSKIQKLIPYLIIGTLLIFNYIQWQKNKELDYQGRIPISDVVEIGKSDLDIIEKYDEYLKVSIYGAFEKSGLLIRKSRIQGKENSGYFIRNVKNGSESPLLVNDPNLNLFLDSLIEDIKGYKIEYSNWVVFDGFSLSLSYYDREYGVKKFNIGNPRVDTPEAKRLNKKIFKYILKLKNAEIDSSLGYLKNYKYE